MGEDKRLALMFTFLVVATMIGCAGLTGCADFSVRGCPPGMDRRGDTCEGFGNGFVYRSIAPVARRADAGQASASPAQRGTRMPAPGGE